MNRKGFTLIELLATLVILGIVVGLSVYSIGNIFGSAKGKSEDVFVGTIKDAMDMYLTSSDVKELEFSSDKNDDGVIDGELCNNVLTKSYGSRKVYEVSATFKSVIDSQFKPITQDDLVNPANEDVACNDAGDVTINVYRDEDYVYYYTIDKSSFGCLKNSGVISNLPEGFVCQ